MPAGEPTLGVTRNGDVFYTALQDSTRVEIMRSTDGGKVWDVVSPTLPTGGNAHLLSLDPYLYADRATGRVFTIDLTVACSYLSFSDDHAKTWTTNPLACGRPINDHQTLFAGPPAVSRTVGYENIVYYCFQDVITSSCSKSLDGALTFAPTGAPAFPPGAGPCFDGGLHGHGVVGADGAIYLPKEHCDQPYLAISTDEGVTWGRVQVADNGGQQDPTVDVDSRGNIYYGWISDDLLPYLSVSRDRGRTWSKPLMIGAPGVLRTNLLTLDVGTPGRVAFLYMGTEDAKSPTTWNGYMGMTIDALSRSPIFYTGRANREADPLKRGDCGPGPCGEEVLDFLDVVIAPDGTVWGSFVDACDTRCARTGFAGGREGIAAHFIGGPQLKS
ncbi:MAG: glycoside hydrolase [Actinomycetota bacterium]|nr:glycoside hydrolase [Actinomycetota bacterium]